MKILYLDLNIRYHNNTRNLIPTLLKLNNEVDVYGPGYLNDDILKKGVSYFYKENGPYDFICSNEHINIFFIENYEAQTLNKYYKNLKEWFFFNFKIDTEILLDMANFFKNHEKRNKILFLLEFDTYWFTKKRERIILELSSYIVGFGKQLISKKENCKNISKESFFNKVNNNWYNFINDYDKVIQLIHFVDLSEFNWQNLDMRKYDCSIPGVGYWARKTAYENLKKSNLKYPMMFYPKVFHILKKLGINVYSNKISLMLYIQLFMDIIENSKTVFTCGSGYEIAIRKFFEIPAKGAILLCLPFTGFKELGFENGENCIICEPEKLSECVKNILNNKDKAEKISKNGREMVFSKHSIYARANQFQSVLNVIKEGRFKSTYWKNGEFIVETK